MQIRDAAKLLYQSEFGGGHMIADETLILKRIQEEFNSMDFELQKQDTTTELIGDDICRIYLSCLTKGLSAVVLNQMFVQSANNRKGTVVGLERKIATFLKACKDKQLPFSEEDAKDFFKDWKAKGYPAISHSDIYRESYHPAYRVIENSYAHVYEAIEKIEQCLLTTDLSSDHPFIIAIDGMSGSGKSTLGELLHMNYPESNLFHMDDYFLQPHQRTAKRLMEAGGNVDYERFKSEILDNLTDKNGLTYKKYDCCTQNLGISIHVPWKPLVIIEGSYSQHPYFIDNYDLRIFCEITSKEQEERILKRNGEYMLQRFKNEWIPKENQYFKSFQIKRRADMVL